MSRYIDADKLIAEIEKRQEELSDHNFHSMVDEYDNVLDIIASLQQEQPNNMIQWTGNNLKEVIDFTGKSPRFGEWFKSWEEYENYVHTHNNILKLFCKDGSHYEVPVGAWVAKTPDGYNVPSVAKYIQQEQPEVDLVPLQEEKMVCYINYCLQREDDYCNCPNCGKYVTGLRLFPYYYDRENNDVYFASVCPECGKIIISKE